MVRELPGPVRIQRERDGDVWRYTAWMPAGGARFDVTQRDQDGGEWGRMDTRRHPDPDSLPEGPVGRVGALITWELERRQEAYAVIPRAFPEAAEGFRSRGCVVALGDPEAVLVRMERKKRGKIPRDAHVWTAPTFAGS